jgi:hypothetical protein
MKTMAQQSFFIGDDRKNVCFYRLSVENSISLTPKVPL